MARSRMDRDLDDVRLPTLRSSLNGPDLCLWCKDCRYEAYADMAALVALGWGDVPVLHLRFRCGERGSRNTGSVGTGVGPSSWRQGYDSEPRTFRIARHAPEPRSE